MERVSAAGVVALEDATDNQLPPETEAVRAVETVPEATFTTCGAGAAPPLL